MTKKSKKRKEISVQAPDIIPKITPVFKDTTGTEALDVFKIADMTGKFFSFIIIAVGIFISVISAYSLIISRNIFLNSLFFGILGFAGTINIICGLLLLAKK
ncbi:hypothetical protein KJN74_01370 [Candidatus Bathyarchaeota archaeon]|nr:hypothetical protein [Candidatus Bathyarchaeota archaeon]